MAKFTREFWLLPLFASVALIFAGWEYAPLVWFLFYVCAGCIVLSLAYRLLPWSVQIAREIKYGRSRYVEAGSSIAVKLRAENKGQLPIPWLVVRDGVPRTIGKSEAHSAEERALWLWPGKGKTLTYTLDDMPRGVHSWEFSELLAGDPLGLVLFQNRVWDASQLVVYPRTVALDTWQFFPRRVDGSAAAKNSHNHDQSQLVGVREYRPGDRLSMIHWKTSARTGILHSKEFSPLLMDSSLVVLDCSASAWEEGFNPLYEEAVTVAASLVRAAWLQRIPVQFHSNQVAGQTRLGVANSAEYTRFLLHMAAIQPSGKQPLSQSIYNELMTNGINIIVVTPVIGGRLQRMLMRLAGKGNTVTVIRVDDRAARANTRLNAASNFNILTVGRAEELQAVRRGSA